MALTKVEEMVLMRDYWMELQMELQMALTRVEQTDLLKVEYLDALMVLKKVSVMAQYLDLCWVQLKEGHSYGCYLHKHSMPYILFCL